MIFLIMITDDENQLIERYYIGMNDELKGVAYKILNDYPRAEEAVQEAFAKLTEKIDLFQKVPDRKRGGYCFMVVRNISINMYNKENKQLRAIVYNDAQMEPKHPEPSVPEIVESRENAEELKKIIRRLDDAYKFPLLLRYSDDLTYKEISDLLEISESLARKRVERALAKLSSMMEEEGFYGKHPAHH